MPGSRRGVSRVVYGGGKVGLMGQLADAALAAGGEVVGVMPAHLVEREIAHPGLSRLEVTSSMHERKAMMAELASGFIALPGGFGTFEEVIEILTWNQLGLMSKPVVFLDVDGFYTPLLDFFDRSVDARFVRPDHRSLAQRGDRRSPRPSTRRRRHPLPPPTSGSTSTATSPDANPRFCLLQMTPPVHLGQTVRPGDGVG